MTNTKTVLLVLVILLYLKLFSFNKIPFLYSEAVHLGGALLLIFLFIIGLVLSPKKRKIRFKKNFAIPVVLFLGSMVASVFPAYIYHGQPIINSVIGMKAFYIYLLYFMLHYFQYNYDDILRVFKFFFFSVIIIYLINYLLLPDPPFYWRLDERRGSYSIFFYGRGFLVLGCFYYLQKFFTDRKISYLILYIVSAVLLVLLASRMLTAAVLVGSALLMVSNFGKSKSYVLLFSLFLVVIFLSFYGEIMLFVSALLDVSIKQFENFDEDIRTRAIAFYITQFQESLATEVFGNSVPFYSEYSLRYRLIADGYKARIGDIGLFGVWVYFGIFAVLSWLIIFKKMFLDSLSRKGLFIKTYFLYIFFQVLTGFATHNPEIMPTTIFALYWYDIIKQNEA